MKRSFSASVLLGLALVICLAGCAKDKPAASARTPGATAALPVLGPAPGWQLKDVNGQVVNFDRYKGKVVVVDFWATWCGPCVTEIPGYIELVKKHGGKGLEIVGISLDQAGPGVVKAFIEKYHINYQVVMGDENVQTAFGGLEAIPTTFLVDRAGQIRDRKVGVEAAADYDKKIAALLN